MGDFTRNSGVSRRDVLVGSVAAATLAATAPGIASAAPKKGGTLRLGLGHGSTTDSLDPATYENGFTGALNMSIHNHLAEIDPTGKLVPELAESWDASDDAKIWTFKLRQGVTFHSGKTLDADDVAASVNHHRGEKSKSAAKGLLEQIAEMKVLDKNTIQFVLKGGNAGFPYIISDYHVAIMPKKGDDVDWQSGVGTAGYILESFEPGVRAKFKRNPNYFKSGRAYFDAVEMIAIIDVTARTNALPSGDIDLMDRCDLKTVHLLARNKNVSIHETTGTKHYTFAMRCDTKPYDDNNVRMALKLSLNREEILKKVLRGHGSLGNDHPISLSNPFFAKDLPQRGYDPDKAKWHLKQAGLSSLDVELSAADAAYPGAVDAAVLYAASAQKAGINIKVIREPNDGYWSNVWMKKAWSAVYWGGRPTEDWMFSTAYAAEAKWNDTFWKHDRFDKLLVEARGELDQGKRRQMYGEMQAIVSNEGGVVVPMFANYVSAVSKKLAHGANVAGNWDLDGGKLAERWWFA